MTEYYGALRLRNLAASTTIVGAACGAMLAAPYHAAGLDRYSGPEDVSFTGREFIVGAAGAYVLLLAVFYLMQRNPGESKSLRFFRILANWIRSPPQSIRSSLSGEDRLALLSTLLKAYFGPMMSLWLMAHCMGAWTNAVVMESARIADVGFHLWFNDVGFWFLMQVILFVDVLVFTVGYLVESPRLNNQIRSVDPTLLGWTAALLCYPPFNAVTSRILGSPVSDFPQFDDPLAHVALNVVLLLLMAIFASASAALGLKASNLTHRGIVARGPYAIVRHPAYVSKNLAWWIASVPAISAAWTESTWQGILTVASIVAWTSLYALRAVTEEDHLRSVDGEYAAYAAKVRYRFIPGVY